MYPNTYEVKKIKTGMYYNLSPAAVVVAAGAGAATARATTAPCYCLFFFLLQFLGFWMLYDGHFGYVLVCVNFFFFTFFSVQFFLYWFSLISHSLAVMLFD